jgi:hypothetical protein
MDARHISTLMVLFWMPIASANEARLGNQRTRNFVVTAPDQQLAADIGSAAEQYRRELAVQWLGKEIPPWPHPCVITATIKPQAFGETSFAFALGAGSRSQPFDFVMKINGSRERLLDSVLPHEISHTIFATHFGQPLPRWADEGACTTVEHITERRKNHQMLIEFLTTNRGIPFNRMFAMKNYPRDILPLYAQGYSLCRYLIQRGGKRKFVQFMDDGLVTANWGSAIKRHYQINDLSELQVKWLAWIKNGCPQPKSDQPSLQVPSQGLASTNIDNVFSLKSASNTAAIPANLRERVQPDPQPVSRQPFPSSTENFYLREIQRVQSGTQLR